MDKQKRMVFAKMKRMSGYRHEQVNDPHHPEILEYIDPRNKIIYTNTAHYFGAKVSRIIR